MLLLMQLRMLLAHTQLALFHDPQVLLSSATPWYVMLQGAVPSYVRYFTFVLVEFPKAPSPHSSSLSEWQLHSSAPGGPPQFGGHLET